MRHHRISSMIRELLLAVGENIKTKEVHAVCVVLCIVQPTEVLLHIFDIINFTVCTYGPSVILHMGLSNNVTYILLIQN